MGFVICLEWEVDFLEFFAPDNFRLADVDSGSGVELDEVPLFSGAASRDWEGGSDRGGVSDSRASFFRLVRSSMGPVSGST